MRMAVCEGSPCTRVWPSANACARQGCKRGTRVRRAASRACTDMGAQSRAAGDVPRAGLTETQPCTEQSPPAGSPAQPRYPQQLLLGCTGGGWGALPGPISPHSPELCAAAKCVPSPNPGTPASSPCTVTPAAPRAAHTKPSAHLRVHTHASVPPPKRKAPAGGRPRSVAVGGAPLAYVAARALRGWARIGGGVLLCSPTNKETPQSGSPGPRRGEKRQRPQAETPQGLLRSRRSAAHAHGVRGKHGGRCLRRGSPGGCYGNGPPSRRRE